jgi:hypothetical protein
VEETPDTVITLADGKKYVVSDSIDEILEKIARSRGRTLYWYRKMVRGEAKGRGELECHEASADISKL